MRKNISLICLILSLSYSSQWVNIKSTNIDEPTFEVINSNIENTVIEFTFDDFSLNEVLINNESYFSISMKGGASNLELGHPNLPHISKSIIIPDNSSMSLEIIEQEYTEYNNILIAPSKGNLSRNINPNQIEYQFDEIYLNDAFYPENITALRDPYIVRDLRGQTVVFTPFQYNPVDKKLRVYHSIKVRVFTDGAGQINTLNRFGQLNSIDNEYKNIYQEHFLNFNNDTRFDYLVDQGNMLIISYGDFMDEMQPLIDWKNKKGIPTEIVDVSTIGTSSSNIESFVSNYYYENGLTFLLLVGDIAQIPSPLVSGSASDVSYGCIDGNDFYPEVIVGRFSGANPSHINTQVERAINYERYPQLAAEWYDNALGVASNQGPGFGGYTDDDFNDFLWDTVLSGFTYDSYEGVYDGSGGSDAQGINAINDGVSIINYTGHGSISSWGNGASLNTTQINQLTNTNMLPFVITVGCNVGEFNSTNECFSESWQRATHNGEPSGGIAHFGSTISQSWEPPMHGQYGMNLILTESYDNQITRSMGGITTNGCMYMNDAQGSSGINETKYWTFFGDPSTNIRTAPPSNLSPTHDDVILVDQQEFVVDVGEEGALVALSRDGELLSSAYTVGGVSVLNLNDAATGTPGVLDLVVTGFNSFTYETEVTVIAPEGAYVVLDNIDVLNIGQGDPGTLLYGQENHFTLNLSNVGTDSAENVIVNMFAEDDFVEILNGTVTCGNISPNGNITVDGWSGLSLNLDWGAPNGHIVDIVFQILTDQDAWEVELPFIVQAPVIVLNSISGMLEPGEDADLEISLSNIGSAPINYPIVSAEGDMYVTVSSSGIGNAYYWDHLYDNEEILFANVSVSSNAPIGHVAEITILVTNLDGGYNFTLPIYYSIGQITENFESGFSQQLNWEFSGDADWTITATDQYEGYYSALSGSISDSQSSSMSVTLDVVLDGEIGFNYRVASEYSPSGLYFYDGLQFYIDDEMVGQFQPTADGDTPWSQVSFPVESGTHTFTWTYIKDGGGGTTDMSEDCSWVDYITFPPSALADEGLLGDINGDYDINVQDIVMMINMVVGNTDVDLTADINSDSYVDVLDIVLVVNIILGR